MSRPDLDADAAVKALAFRLRDWNVPDPALKARAFIDDLQARGWRVSTDPPTRRPPKPHEECADHPGEYRLSCRLHAADLKARRDERWGASSSRLTREQAIQAMRENLAASQHRLDVALNRTPEETV